jgi:hypothetical protein
MPFTFNGTNITAVNFNGTNVTTVIVKDQFGNPVSGQGVSVSVATTPAPATTTA